MNDVKIMLDDVANAVKRLCHGAGVKASDAQIAAFRAQIARQLDEQLVKEIPVTAFGDVSAPFYIHDEIVREAWTNAPVSNDLIAQILRAPKVVNAWITRLAVALQRERESNQKAREVEECESKSEHKHLLAALRERDWKIQRLIAGDVYQRVVGYDHSEWYACHLAGLIGPFPDAERALAALWQRTVDEAVGTSGNATSQFNNQIGGHTTFLNQRALLKKYMRFILAEEGTMYLDHYPPTSDRTISITDEEMRQLRAIEVEIWKETNG